MSSEQYCEPCERLLYGKAQSGNESKWGIDFTHHSDAKSFQDALGLPCIICSYAWSHEEFSPNWQENILNGTTGHLRTSDLDANAIELRFIYGDYEFRSKVIALVPWKNDDDHQFPNLLSRNTGSMSALTFLLSKYQECHEKHVGCRLQLSPVAIYPSRIIDVGKSGDSLIYLRDTQDLSNRGLYTCLSHCWGQKQPFKLTKGTKSMLQDGIIMSVLPKTFQEAIFVTRLLGIRFLWIDSLCIFQDSKADWSYEASRMGDIYSQAVCTIAATAAEDSDGGLFFERNATLLRPWHIETTWSPNPDAEKIGNFTYPQSGLYWCDNRNLWTEAVEWTPLNSRAWVCQERHLSQRVMYFSRTQLFWECHEVTACENYPSSLPQWALPFWCHSPTGLKQDLYQRRLQKANMSLKELEIRGDIPIPDTKLQPDHKLYFSWAVFRIHYTECAMTKEEDKLVAIKGIARQFGLTLGDHLVAGLWYNRLLEELCWFKSYNSNKPLPLEPSKWRAPTWSWASSNAKIWVSCTTKFHRDCQNKQIWIEREDLNVKAKASGELDYASLRIRCKPICAIIKSVPGSDNRPCHKFHGILTFRNSMMDIPVLHISGTGINIYIDDWGWEGTRHVQMIVIQRCPHPSLRQKVDDEDDEDNEGDEDDGDKKDCVEGLLLVPQHGCDDVYERVGLFWAYSSSTVSKVLDEHEAAESRIITLI